MRKGITIYKKDKLRITNSFTDYGPEQPKHCKNPFKNKNVKVSLLISDSDTIQLK